MYVWLTVISFSKNTNFSPQMAKVQKLEESLCATEKVISSLEKSREADKVGKS